MSCCLFDLGSCTLCTLTNLGYTSRSLLPCHPVAAAGDLPPEVRAGEPLLPNELMRYMACPSTNSHLRPSVPPSFSETPFHSAFRFRVQGIATCWIQVLASLSKCVRAISTNCGDPSLPTRIDHGSGKICIIHILAL